MEDIEIKVLANKENDWKLMLEPWCQFFKYEPITGMVTELQEPESREYLADLLYSASTLDPESPCVIAWDRKNNRTAGMIVTHTKFKDPPPDIASKEWMAWQKYPWKDPQTLPKLKAVDNFLDKMFEKCDVLNKYGVDKALYIHITSVCKDYTRRGLANRMTDLLIKEAKARGYPLVISESTSAFTQRSKINNFGFETVLELDYENNYTEYTDMTDENKKLHRKGCVLAKRL